jgi:hypothetical protein
VSGRVGIWRARIIFGWRVREWPWRVPREVARIGSKHPPEHVFEAFRRIHDVEHKDGTE